MSLARLEHLSRTLKRLPATLEAATGNVVRAHVDTLADINTGQLDRGKDAAGADIRPAYTPLTRVLKQLKGQPADRVTLRDEGDFYTSIVAQVRGQTVEMEATDNKTTLLTQKYGEEILGLPEEGLEEFRQAILRPALLDQTREKLAR